MEQEKTEAENRRIMEFASQQEHAKETRMAKIREREEAKEHLHKLVETMLILFICSFNDTPVLATRNHLSLFSSCLRRLKRRGSSAKRWSESARNFV